MKIINKKSFWPLCILIISIFAWNSGILSVVSDLYKKQTTSYNKINVQVSSLSLVNISDLYVNGDSLQGVGENGDPYMVFNMPEKVRYINNIKFNINVDSSSVVQFFFKKDVDENFSEVNSIRTNISEGDNIVTISLPLEHAVEMMSSIRIDPVEGDKKFKISNIVIN